MKTPQLWSSALVLVALTSACSRVETDANKSRAAEQVKAVAERTGHQLADSWLTTKIQAQYFADDDIKARHINVSTRDGLVRLSGYVDNAAQRDLAVQIAKTTDGVRGVTDQLSIAGAPAEGEAVATTGTAVPGAPPAPAASSVPDDALVTARVQSRFFVDDRVKARRIDVDTRDGIVTLSGEVESEDERAQALLLARTADGVRRVEDHLSIVTPPATSGETPRVDDAMLTTTIQAKYFVDDAVKGSAVDVSVKDGVVLLQGRVRDEAAHEQAVAIARNTTGVLQVVDRLTVAPTRR